MYSKHHDTCALANIRASLTANQTNQPTEKERKVREEYERKLSEMQKEMKRLQLAKKEHARLIRNQTEHENQVKTLKNELQEMKRAKVGLLISHWITHIQHLLLHIFFKILAELSLLSVTQMPRDYLNPLRLHCVTSEFLCHLQIHYCLKVSKKSTAFSFYMKHWMNYPEILLGKWLSA